MSMDEKAIEREQIECVFNLGGGELHVPNPEFPDEWDGIFAYWYDGVPSYAKPDFPEVFDSSDDDYIYRTAIVCELYGQAQTPEGWERVAAYGPSSGESECWWRGGEIDNFKVCPLCETPIVDGEHPIDGHVYIGDGWQEVVYRTEAEDEE